MQDLATPWLFASMNRSENPQRQKLPPPIREFRKSIETKKGPQPSWERRRASGASGFVSVSGSGQNPDDDVVVHRIRDRMRGPTRQTAGSLRSEKSGQGQTDKCKKHQRCAPGKIAGQGCSVAGNRLFQLVHFWRPLAICLQSASNPFVS